MRARAYVCECVDGVVGECVVWFPGHNLCGLRLNASVTQLFEF
jgi:hypothetical protein